MLHDTFGRILRELRRAPESPPKHAVTVGGFHTHPNVGPKWGAPFASGADVNWATRNGIKGIDLP